MTIDQLTLNIHLRDDATFANYLVGVNVEAVNCLRTLSQAQSEIFVYLWGEPGVGCTHLLQACCHAYQAQELSAMYLPLAEYQNFSPNILSGMEELSLVTIDNIEKVIGLSAWEEALFHFYNRARERQLRLVVAAQQSPHQLSCRLADLQSRLNWGLVFKLNALTDSQKMLALQQRAKRRGMILREEVAQYLLNHFSRNMTDLTAALDQLEKATLAAQRRLTIPFVKDALL